MNMKYTERPVYETVDIVGKTVDTTTGTSDRKLVGRCLITTQAGFEGKHVVVNGDDTPIRTVEQVGGENATVTEIETFVELVGGIKSLASVKFFTGYTAKNPENEGVIDLFTDEIEKIERVVAMAARMCTVHPECDSQWKIVDAAGNRIFLRLIAKALSSTGKVEG